MRSEEWQDVHTLFDDFINELIINKNSFLTAHTNILNEDVMANIGSRFIDNFDDNKGSFETKLNGQFENSSENERLVFAHAEWLWAYAVNDLRQTTKINYTSNITSLTENEIKKDNYPIGFGSAGQFHKTNKYWEISFNLKLISFLITKINEETTNEEIKKWIEAICLHLKYYKDTDGYIVPDIFREKFGNKALSMYNILPFCAFPDKYERIASNAHKSQIYNSFKSLISEEDNDDLKTDECIFLIRQKLSEINEPNFDFYENKYRNLWNYSENEIPYDELQALNYKKSIVLYGPPGTSKTYAANRLAKAYISNEFLKQGGSIKEYFSNSDSITNDRIHRLQLHSNYTYEDFVAGMQLTENKTKAIKGKLFDICSAAKDDNLPHILILDEINRVDLSRLFGEVFSAMENRGTPITTAVGKFELTIPENLYIIGTMNEIDFSLERMDFALRRRFLWFFYGYSQNTLYNMIWNKNQLKGTKLPEDEIDCFIKAVTALNNEISITPDLGEQFQIGHTFFAEIVDIFDSYKLINNKTNRITKKIYRDNGPIYILWDISIQPMLDAFLGNMEDTYKIKTINKLKEIYFS